MRAVCGVWMVCGLAACGSRDEACLDYTEAYQSCVEEAEAAGLDVDVETDDPEGFCEAFADETDEVWACQAAAVRAADCATNEGVAAMTAALDACLET